ncbi:hypothetical protein J6Z19_03470 [bacterium]|nr:hypothetical protein [bacterium]
MKKIVFAAVFLIFCSISAQDETQIFTAQLYNQAALLLNSAKSQCKKLSEENQSLANAVSELYKKAEQHKNVAVNVFANSDYLLKFLQERIDRTCGLVEMANNESVRLIIAQEFDLLLAKKRQSGSFEDFIDKIFGTEYAKLLYLATSVSSLEKMYKKWAEKMVSERKDMKKTISNIAEANTELKRELTDFTKTFKLYYEKTFK